MADSTRNQAIAIVGMSGRFPGAAGLDAFWRNIRDGVESLDAFSDADLDAARIDPALRADPRYVRQGTVLENADHFDASFFGFSPREAQILDPQQRVFLECAWEALEHAGYAGSVGGQSVGVYAGVGINAYILTQLIANRAFVASVGGYQLMIGNDKDFLSTRVSYKLDLRGPSITVQTACSTSLVAVTMACRALQRGECDMAMAGGVAIVFPQRAGYLFEEGMIFSPDGHCRPFDEKARGTRGGSGAGIVVLKRLADAVADRDTIHAVILGAAMNNDGAGKAGYTAPSVDGQVEVIATAQALGDVNPRSIGYVEAHGTGTPLGDPIEIAALTQAFRASTDDVGFCRIGSLKANIGHLDAAAGVAGLIKTVLALKNRELPPLVNFQTPNPQLALDTSPFVASPKAAAWSSPAGALRRAGVSSFGIGGTNAHVVVEEAPVAEPTSAARDAHLLILSAKNRTALDKATTALEAHLVAHPDLSLADVEHTLGVGRQAFAHRRAIVVRDRAHALDALSEAQRAQAPTAIHEGGARPVAFLFSGQGSQHVGMGAGLYKSEPVYREAFDRCATLLEPHLGLDLRQIVFGPDDSAEINKTSITQPALFAIEYALASLWMSRGVVPSAMLGHSIGEYVAAHLAGVLSLEDALAVVAARGRFMQALPAGTMAAVRLGASELERLLIGHPDVEIAARNAPELCTISGPSDAIASFRAKLEANGVDVRPLHTSHAFHSAMMEPALAPFTALLQGVSLSAPRIPYLSNLTGTWITDEEATSPAYYAEHLRHAVQFEAGVRTLAADGSTLLLEIGPGNALTSLARLTLGKDGGKRVVASLGHPKESRSDSESNLEAAGRLWLAGVSLDWARFHPNEPRRIPLPTYPFERKRYWVDADAPDTAERATNKLSPALSVDESLFAPTWIRDSSPAAAPRLSGTWLVLAPRGGTSLSDAVVQHAANSGAAVVVLEAGDAFARHASDRYSVRPGSDDFGQVIRELRTAGAEIAGAIDLWNTAPLDATPADISYYSLVSLAEALDATASETRRPVVVATSGAQSVLDEPVLFPEHAIVLGPVKALGHEMPNVLMKAVDLQAGDDSESVDRAALAVVREAAIHDGEDVIAYRAGRRFLRRVERAPVPAANAESLPLVSRGVYLVTGGLGGIGLTLARWLAKRASARLVLTTRTALPPSGDWDAWLNTHSADDRASVAIRAIREIENDGGEVLVAQADSADEAAMRRAVDEARTRWGSIQGIIHAAGIPGDGRLAVLKRREDVAAVFAPKIQGIDVLTKIFGESPLDFVVLLSSFNTMLGAPGLSDYTAANAVLDAFVASKRRPSGWQSVSVINYGPWRDVGMAARLRAAAPGRGREQDGFEYFSMSPAAGADAFERLLASGREQLVAVPQDFAKITELARGASIAPRTAPTIDSPRDETATPRLDSEAQPSTTSTSYVAPETATERDLVRIWSEALGVDRIGVHDDFFELGGHSLVATRVIARIDQALGARLALRDIFDSPTVRALAQRVDSNRATATPSLNATDDDREELEF